MTYKHLLSLFTLMTLAAMFTGCAEEQSESEEHVQRRLLEAYIKVNYGDQYQPTASGMYIIPLKSGTGDFIIQDSCYVLVNYEVRSMGDIILESSYESTAQAMGTYAPNHYYGRHLWKIGEGGVNDGLEELLRSIRMGGASRGIIPPWLASENANENITASGSESIIIYDVQLDSMIRNRQQYEYNRLQKFSYDYYENMDSLAKGFYFKRLTTSNDTIPDNVEVQLRYVGRYLSGKVFDTNIADTAKRYGFYSGSDNNYTTLGVTYRDSLDRMLEDSELVDGFTRAVHGMNFGERAITFFSSDWGYGSTSQASTGGVPAWEPLFFEIWIDPKN